MKTGDLPCHVNATPHSRDMFSPMTAIPPNVMNSCTYSLPRRLLLSFALLFAISARAFFPEPDPLNLDVGTSGVVKVNGSDAKAKVSLQSITIVPADGGVTHDLKGARNGTGFVNVNFTGVKPGNYVVTFSGKNNGFDVQGSITVIVRHPPSTSAQNFFFAVAGDPVNTRSGEYFGMEAVDLNLGGPMPLVFARYAASNMDDDGLVQAALGANRSHNFASRIVSEVGSSVKRVVLPSGRVLFFQQAGTKWVLKQPLDVPFQLVETGGNFLLGHPGTKQIWTYDSGGLLRKIEDGKGNTHTLDYTAGKLTSISDGLGRVIEVSQPGSTIESVTGVTGMEEREVAFAYTGGVLTSATDYGGHTTTYANSGGRPTSITRAEGNELFTQSYTGSKVTSQTERGTDTSTLDYQPASTTFTDPAGETLVDHYDESGNLTSHVDETGKAITMTYDSAGRRGSVTDRLGRTVTTLYHAPSGQPAMITNAEGRRTLFAYKTRTLSGLVFHDLVKITWPDGASRSYVYDARGNITQVKDETGKTWKYTFNNRGQALTITNPLGGVTTHTYDGFGNLATSQPPDTGMTTFDYDDRLRLEEILRPGGATVVIAYDSKDRVTTVTDERGKVYQYGYDDNNRLTSVTDPDNETAMLGHDVLDRVTSMTDRLSQQSTRAFNSRRLLSSLTDRNGNTVEMNYDARQRLTDIEDAGGQHWTLGYDEEGRLTSFQNPVDPPATRRLNRLGFASEVSDPLGNTRRFVRDAMQRVTHLFDPLGRQTTRVYDKMGRLAAVTEQGTGTAKYTRDALGSVTKLTDPNGGSWSTAYLKSGRVQKLTDPLGKATGFTYDTRGRFDVATFPDGATCTVGYDDASHPTSIMHSAGPNLAFTYDNLGRLESAKDTGLAAGDVDFEYDAEGRLTNCRQNTHDFTATYDDGGRLLTVGYLDGAFTVTYGYDSRDRLTSVTDSEGTALALGYDDAGRMTSLTRPSGVNGTYTYDAAGRLTRIEEGGIIDLVYTLNPASEVTQVDFTAPEIPGVTPETQLLKFGKAGEITTTGYAYDARGRLTNAPGGRVYQWDGASRLVNANGVALAYNGLGDIITRTEGGDTTRYYHHHALGLAPIVYEDPPAGSDRAYVWTPGGRLLYSVDLGTGDPTFYHFDRMGSTLALTDKNGDPTDAYAYGPFGEPLAHSSPGTPSTQPFTYIGAFGVRAEGPLHHMRARYYDPMTARFLSRDPLAPRLDDLKSTNRYAYASQNPLLYLDPEGEKDRTGSQLGVQISGYGRFGLDYEEPLNKVIPVDGPRLRFNIDVSGTTDSGITFGGRIRMQSDDRSGEVEELDPAIIYAEASGFRVAAGAAGAGHSNAYEFAGGASGKGAGSMGLFASYSVSGLVERVNYSSSGVSSSMTTPYNAETGHIGGGKTSAAGQFGSGISIIIPAEFTISGESATIFETGSNAHINGASAAAPVVPVISYDIGGASIEATISRGFGANTHSGLGIRFDF